MKFLLVETAGDEKSELLIRIPQQKSVVILHLLQPTAPFKSRLCVSRSILYFGQTVKKNVKELRTYFSILFSSGRFEQEWTRSRSRSGPLLFSNHRFLGRRWHHHPPVSISCVLLRCCLFCAEFRKDDLQRRWSNSTTTTTTTTTKIWRTSRGRFSRNDVTVRYFFSLSSQRCPDRKGGLSDLGSKFAPLVQKNVKNSLNAFCQMCVWTV